MLSLIEYIKRPTLVGIAFMRVVGSRLLSDKQFLLWNYRLHMGKRLDLKSPKTFNDKLNWLKLYDRNPKYIQLVDKYAVKEYVANIIGEQYVIPTIGVWNNPKEIDFDTLPNQFVLKTTHGGGNCGVVICKDKSTFNRIEAIKKLNRSLKQDIYRESKEWPYKNVPRRIIAEKYMEDETGELRDYKFFAFDGIARAMFIATERSKGDHHVKFDFFDMDFIHLPFMQGHPNAKVAINKPVAFDKMKELAGLLSKGFPHVRVDFYEINGNIYFGELTFYHFGAVVPFEPEVWDEKFGEYLILPKIN